jgi:dsDNA-specific endonuclease/ATPase MutS2
MNSKNSEVELPEEGQKLSRIPFTKYIDLGTKDNPNVENQLRVFYSTIKEIQIIRDRITHVAKD